MNYVLLQWIIKLAVYLNGIVINYWRIKLTILIFCNIFIFSFHYILKICFIHPETVITLEEEKFCSLKHFITLKQFHCCTYAVTLFLDWSICLLLSFKIDFIQLLCTCLFLSASSFIFIVENTFCIAI